METRKGRKLNQMDFPLLIAITLICGFGLVMLFSASYYYAQSNKDYNNNGFHYLTNQAVWMGLGFVAMYLVSRVNYKWWNKMRIIGLVVTLALMVAVLIFGVERNGAKRWLEIGGVSMQPSEFAKFALILYMASFMAQRPNAMKKPRGMILMLLIMGIMCVFLLLQDNLSMMIILVLAGMIMLFLGGVPMKYLLLMAALAGGAVYLASREPYRWSRLVMFSDPWNSTEPGAYQLRQSLLGFGAGGLFGSGLNFSRQKLLFLPYGESDFIFSIIGEELGFIGCLLLIAAYVFAIYRGIRIAIRCKDRFGGLLAAGITSVLAIQVAVNMAVATSSIPPTGQTLPFVSSGGTSLLIFLVAMGILLNISRDTS